MGDSVQPFPAGQNAPLAGATLLSLDPTSGPPAGGNTVVLTGTGFVGVSYVRFGGVIAAFSVDSSSRITAVAPAGTGSVAVTVTTPSGTSNPLTYTYALAPTLISITPTSGPAAGGNTVVLTGTDLASTTAVRFGTTPASFTITSPTQITAVVPAGTGSVAVTVTTPSGTSNPLTYTYTLAPTLASATPDSGPATGGNTIVLTGNNLTGTTSVLFGATPASAFTVISDAEISAIAPVGTGTVGITATTTGGTSNAVLYTYIPAPVLASVVPNEGPATGGNTVTLIGSSLSGATSVQFGDIPAVSFAVVSDTQITAVVPAGATGPVVVTVATNGGISGGVIYTYVTAPTLIALIPSTGPETGGNTVTIEGTGFTGAQTVGFGDTPSVPFTVVSDTEITTVAPPGSGTVTVTVTATGGTSNPLPYTYVPVPVLADVVPTAGPENGGNFVLLTGTGFTGTTAVHFGANPAVAFTVVSDTQIAAEVPAGTGPVDITVTTAGGISSPITYTYVPAPVLTAITPGSGPETGGNTVTITGTALATTGAVHFGTATATFIVISDTEVRAVVPAGTGLVDVTVSTTGGTSIPVTYTYVAVPVLEAISPESGPETGGNTVILSGIHLAGTTAVSFDGVPAASFSVVSDAEVSVVVPGGSGTVVVTVSTPGGTSNPITYTYLSTPTLTTSTPETGPETGGNTIVLTGTGLTTTTAVLFGAVPAVAFTVISDTEITAIVPAGTGTADITATTLGGTSNPITYTYLPAPALVGITPDTGPETGGNTVFLTGANLSTITSVVFGTTPATTFTVISDTEITAVVPAGTGTADVTATTIGGTSNAVLYTYLPAPTLTTITPDTGPEAGGNTVVLTGTNLSTTTSVLFGTTPAVFAVVSDDLISVTVPPSTPGTVVVTATTVGGTSNPLSYTYAAAPTLVSIAPLSGPTAGGNAVVLTGSGFTDATAVTFGAVSAVSFVVVSDSEISALVPSGAAGTVTVTVTATGGTSNGVHYTYVPTPVVVAVIPDTGPQTGGNTVVISGTGFTDTTSVDFGTTAAAYSVDSDTQITAVAPAGTGTVTVGVTTPGGTSNGVAYSYVAAPTVTSITPNSGPATGGNTVVLLGTHLATTTAVLFGATSAAAFTVVSDNQVNAVAPAGTVGTVAVTATTAGGVSNSVLYTYVAAPTLTSITPTSGPSAGGNTVILTGTGFTGAGAVDFGAIPATSFSVVSSTQIIAVVPAGSPGPVAVTATTVGGTSNGLVYTYLAPPTLTALNPNQGPQSGNNFITITGTGFTGATAVRFGTTPATNFTVLSATQIRARVPAGTGVVTVTVVAPGGTSNGLPYTYQGAPTLTSVTPSSGSASGGNSVTLSGSALTGATSVQFGGTPAVSFVVNSSNQITAVVPAGPPGPAAVTVTTAGGTSNPVTYTYV